MWPLAVTWRRWRSHHWIRHTRKTNAICKYHGTSFYRTGVMGDGSLHCGNGNFWPWPWPDDLHIQTWPVLPEDTPGCTNMNFLCQCFQKVSSVRHTEKLGVVTSGHATKSKTLQYTPNWRLHVLYNCSYGWSMFTLRESAFEGFWKWSSDRHMHIRTDRQSRLKL